MINLTDSAVNKVKTFFETPEAKGKSLRIAVEPGGCSGYQYAFGFDVKKPEDKEVPFDGFSVLIDPQSAAYLQNSQVDYIEDAAQAGFKIHNPNVKKSCGCGKSNTF